MFTFAGLSCLDWVIMSWLKICNHLLNWDGKQNKTISRSKYFSTSIEMSLRPCPHYGGEIWKRSFVSAAKPTVYTNSSLKRSILKTLFKSQEIENEVFLSAVRPTVHTNPSLKRRISKTLFKSREFENAGFSFSCGRKTLFWNRWFWKTMASLYSCDFPERVSTNTNPKWPMIISLLNSSDVV